MLLMQQHQDGLRRRLFIIGIPTYAINQFSDLIVKWEKGSGVEWTIARLKSLKVSLIRQKSGLPCIESSWVRKNSKGEYYGVIGSLFRWGLSSDRNFKRCVQAFNAYTHYVLPGLTESQKEKFLSGINPLLPDGLTDEFHLSFHQGIRRSFRRRNVGFLPTPLVTYQGSPDKKAPRLFGRKSVRQSDGILDELEYFNTDDGLYLYTRYKSLYEPLLEGIGDRKDDLNWVCENSLRNSQHGPLTRPDSVYGGEIHFLQEPGGKLRSIASPLRLHQEALRPLGQALYGIVKSLPWDCTFDQSKAIPHIQSCLRQGNQVHSVDLSSATDHFPLSLQMTALRAIFPDDDDHLDLFEEISRGNWKSPIGSLKWTKGQPLGLYPSFASFTLTHGLLLLHLADYDFHNQFFVVGDDVVILDDCLYSRYISMLDRMSCPWSIDKSLSSDKLSEFAGKIVTPFEVIPQLKWRRMSDDNFLDICRLLGRKSYNLLSSRQKRVFDNVAHLCEPIGLNFSLPDDNLTKMVMRTLDFYQPEKVVLGSLMGLRKKLNRLVYTSTEDFNSEELLNLSVTFDEKVKLVLAQTVFCRWDSSISFGLEAFEQLPSALGLEPRLPYNVAIPTRITTLDRYERLLLKRNRR